MDEVKDKMKGLMKKMSSSSSGKFKGQGRVLGSAPAPVSTNTPSNFYRQNPTPTFSSSSSSSSSSTLPTKPLAFVKDPPPKPKIVHGFDPYDSLITTGKRSQNGYSLNVFQCPICNQDFKTEEEVSEHVEACVNKSDSGGSAAESGGRGAVDEDRSRMEVCVGGFLSGSPKESCVEVVRTLLRNVVKEPANAKFRRIRMSNPRIREAIGDVVGGVEVLELVGFGLREEGGEMWAVMEVPDDKGIGLIKKVIELLGPRKVEEPLNVESLKEDRSPAPASSSEPVEPRKFDRQV